MKLIKVTIRLMGEQYTTTFETSCAYTKDGFYCVVTEEGEDVHKYPIANIAHIHEKYAYDENWEED